VTATPALNAAICKVMASVRHVRETGKNEHHGYKYASDEDLLASLQPAMAEAGLALLPSAVAATIVEHGAAKSGKVQWRTDLLVTYELLHSSGESRTIQVPGCGIDPEDKGAYKAMTGALKYALRHTFLVPTGDDPERDTKAGRAEAAPAPAPAKTAAKPSRAAGPDAGVVGALVAAGWPEPSVVENIRDFSAWMGVAADPWAADAQRQAKLPEWLAAVQVEVGVWKAWCAEYATTLRELELSAVEVDAWCVANKRGPAGRLAAKDRPKLVAYLRDAGGADKVRELRTVEGA
jgi:hypothetical protein